MTAESSRKTEAGTPLSPGGCPRCGTRLGEPYKYCPNCAYRLRPDLFPTPQVRVEATPLSHRVVALGGYLLFASMLLLVVFAGVRLFARPEPPDLVRPQVIRARDGQCLELTLEEFVEVPAGTAFWGLYDPGREYAAESGAEAAAEEKKAAERAEDALAILADENALPEEVEEARSLLAKEIYPSAREAMRRWADASKIVVPQEPIEGTPEGYFVDDPFRMSRREVTNDQYFEFLRAWARKSGRPVLAHLIPGGWKRATGSADVPRIYRQDEGDLPVVGIPFDAALEFCGWFWEERLGADPDLVVDLPTWKEFVLAARGDHLTYNFPWGRGLRQGEKANLDNAGVWSVTKRMDGDVVRTVTEGDPDLYNGFLDLVGNAAEWVYWRELIYAAGWSYEDAWVYKVSRGEAGQPARLATPFSPDGFHVVVEKQRLRDVGFRPVIRRAPALPSFVPVTKGPVRCGRGPDGILPPERLDADEADEAEGSEPETLEQIRARREPAISFAAEAARVDRDFEISATEVTNRQYLAFLSAIAPQHTKDDLEASFVPRGWRRKNLLVRYEEGKEDGPPLPRAFDGYYVPWEKLETLYAPGQENVPVQGIAIHQVEAYTAWLSSRLGRRCSIPTVAQFLRAARGDGLAPYAWGDDRTDPELLPSCRQEPYYTRAFSLPVSPARPIVGLAGNVAELVRDPDGGDRLLLAGGFYDLPPRLVTLDCFLDANWDTIQYVLEPGDWDFLEPGDWAWPLENAGGDAGRTKLSAFFRISVYTGFRVVRLPGPF